MPGAQKSILLPDLRWCPECIRKGAWNLIWV